jgi:PAS domain S-box-containing protein
VSAGLELVLDGLEALDDGVAVFDAAERLVACNARFKVLRGYPDELSRPGIALADLVAFNAHRGDYGPGLPADLAATRLAEIRSQTEKQGERHLRDGRSLLVRHARLGNGGLLLSYRDVSEIRSTEAALRQSEQRNALVTQAATEGLYDWDISNDRLYVSPQLNALFGFAPDLLQSQVWNDRIVPEDYHRYRQALRDYFRRRTERFHCEYRIRVASGDVRWVRDSALAVHAANGRAIRLVGAVSDITEAKRMVEALAQSEERYSHAVEAMNESLYDWNLADGTIFFSPRMLALFGRPAKEMRVPADWVAVIHPEDLPAHRQAVIEHLKGRSQRLVTEYRYRHGDGTWHWARQHGLAQRNAEGRAVRMVGSSSDITEEKQLAAALRESEARYAQAMQAIGEGLYEWDIARDQVYYSDSVYEMLNLRREHLRTAGDWLDRIHPDDLPRFRAATAAHLAGRTQRFDCEVRYRDSSEAWRWARQHGMAIPDQSGRAVRMIGATGDITESKRLAAALAEAESRLSAAIEAISEGFALWDANDCLVACNSVYRAWFVGLEDLVVPGESFDRIIRTAWARGIFPDAGSDAEAFMAQLQERRLARAGAREQHLKGGIWLQVSDRRMADGGLVSIYTDISEQKRRQRELADMIDTVAAARDDASRARRQLDDAIESISEGFILFDRDDRLVLCNQWFREFYAGVASYLQPGVLFRDLLQRASEWNFVPPDGTDLERWIEWRLEHHRNPGEQIEIMLTTGRWLRVSERRTQDGGYVAVYADITELKRREAELAQLVFETRTARDAAEAALQELKVAQASLVHAEKMASLGQLTAGIAHEIKNPLNFVNNFSGLSVELLDEFKTAAAPALAALDAGKRAEIDETIDILTGNLQKIAEHGRRADGIVKSMLLHSRGGSGERQAVDLNGLIEEALNLAYHGARAQDQNFNITLERDFDSALKPVEIVPQDVTRVFLNLIGNGFYAARKRQEGDAAFRPVLRVATRDLGEAVEARIRDNGTGIAPEALDKLFQPFFTTKPTGEGTGLGLSISYDIVTQAHGGTIEVASEVGQFTEFTVRLPRRRAVA